MMMLRASSMCSRAMRSRSGFSLVLMLTLVSALLLMVVAVFSTVRFESMKATAFDNAFRAELAADAGLEDAIARIAQVVDSDGYVIFQSRRPDGTRVLLGAKWRGADWKIVPLFSGGWQPGNVASLGGVPDVPEADGEVQVLPWMEEARADAVELTGINGSSDPYTITRYRFWVEDLQGYLNADVVGNTLGGDDDGADADGSHLRSGYPFGTPGITSVDDRSLPAMSDTALFLIDPAVPAGRDSLTVDFDNVLVAKRGMLKTNRSMFHVLPGSLARGRNGHLIDERLKAFEENVVVGLRPYDEQVTVPFIQTGSGGLVYANAGALQVNLNRVLAEAESDVEGAVDMFANQIEGQLPYFETGRVGVGSKSFVEDYLRTLAANAIDYADADDASTFMEGKYRGIDAYPLVNELHYRFRWVNVGRKEGRLFAVLQVTPFVELWNMTNRRVTGTARLSFECGNEVLVGSNKHVFDDPGVMLNPGVCTPTPERIDGLFYCPPFHVDLQPNQCRMVAMQTYQFKLDGGADMGSKKTFIPSELHFYGNDTRGYNLLWNGRKVDRARGGCERNGGTLYFPGADRQQYRTTLPGHSCGSWPHLFYNVGDPRAAYYINAMQGACWFPHNAASPNRRNIRWEIHQGDTDKVYGRVRPSEWGDGGHDSPVGDVPPGVRSHNNHRDDMIENAAHGDTDVSLRFRAGQPALTDKVQKMAPQRISNLGYFVSETELGHVFDPLPIDQRVGLRNPDGDGFFDIDADDLIDNRYCGGHTLRIGRPAHSRFASHTGVSAWHLLDLFHAGKPRGESRERTGAVREIFGQVNLNTASHDVLRAISGGVLKQDPAAGFVLSPGGFGVDKTVEPAELSAPTDQKEADIVADSIIRWREEHGPFVSPSQLSQVRVGDGGGLLFGNKDVWVEDLDDFEWSDAMCEELFARTYNSATTRSRNFRVFVVGEVLNRVTGQVVGRYSKVVHLFADPGGRDESGKLQLDKSKITVTYESSL